MAQSMDVDKSTDNTSTTNNSQSKEAEYELSAQLSMHTSPARCVVAIDDDTIISGGRKEGEFIKWTRLQSQKVNTDPKDDENDEKMNDISTSPIQFDGTILFPNDNFHPLTFCATKSKMKFDPPRVVSGGSDQRAVVWDINGNIYQQLSGHSNSVNSVDVTDDGHIVTGSYDSLRIQSFIPLTPQNL